VNVGFGDAWGAMFPGGSGIVRGKVLIGDYGVMHKEVTEKTLKIITIDTIFIILGLIDFLIVLFLIKTALGPISEFKWLLLTSFFLLLGSAGHDINFVYSISIIDTNLSMAIAMLILPYTTAMYFWSQSRDVQRGVIVVMSLVWAVNVFVVLVPSFPNVVKTFCWYIWNLQAVLFFLYSIFSACRGVINRRVGAIAQLLGIAVYVISIRSQWLPMEHFDHRNVQIGSLFYRYTLLVAYFQQMAKIRIDHKELNIKLVSVVEKVRHSIARELHDGIGQYLASVKLQTKLSEKSNKLNYSIIYEQLDHSIVELRRLINGLHPVIVDELSMAEALHLESKKLMEVYSVIIDVDADEVTLNEISRANIFRIFQECVANAIKHGDAKEVSIKLKSYKNTVKIEIRDNGKGFVPDQKSSDNQDGGYGLISIYERVSLLNGAINIKSTPSEGTSVTIELPLTSSNLD